MKGQRLSDGYPDWSREKVPNPTPHGAYWKDDRGEWSVCTPNGRIGSIAKHTVTEHEDGTITVAPSILVYPIEPRTYTPEERAKVIAMTDEAYVAEWERGKPGYHGYLERGVWRAC